MSETVNIVVGWDDDQDAPYAYADPTGDAADGREHCFNVVVPADVWARYEQAVKALVNATDEVVDASGFDTSEMRMAERCPEWIGDAQPGRTWWQVVLSASGNEDEWPIRDAALWHADSQEMALAEIASLPDEFYAQATGHHFVRLTRDRLSVARSGMNGYETRCFRCGWNRSEHKA